MTEILFLTSIQGHAEARTRTVAEQLKRRLPEADVKVLEGARNKDLMATFKVKFGPAVIIDNRLEYVGVPRLSMLLDRVAQVKGGKPSPRSSGEKPVAAPAKPATPPPPPPTRSPAPPPPKPDSA